MDAIRRMDSDVLSIESSRSDLKLLSAFEVETIFIIVQNVLNFNAFSLLSIRISWARDFTISIRLECLHSKK